MKRISSEILSFLVWLALLVFFSPFCLAESEQEKLTRSRLFANRQRETVVESIEIPEPLLKTPQQTSKGNSITLADFKGRITLLAMISSRSHSSPKEIKMLNSLRHDYSDKQLAIVVLIVKDDMDESNRAKLFDLLKTAEYPVLDWGPGSWRKQLTDVLIAPAVLEMPTNIVLGSDQKMVVRFGGFETDPELQLRDWLNRLLKFCAPSK